MGFGKPQRLEYIFQKYERPLYFITFCTTRRAPILANEGVNNAIIQYGKLGTPRNVSLGRYVIMPDHIHLFVRGPEEFHVGAWVAGLKRVVAAAVSGGRGIWQRWLLRSFDSQ